MRFTKAFFVIFSLFCFQILEALPVRNPSAPKSIEEGIFFSSGKTFSGKIGYQGDFLLDGKMKRGQDKIDFLKEDTQGAVLTLNFQNRCDLYGVFGESRMRSEWRFPEGVLTSMVEMESHYRFSWAAGLKGILFEWGNAALGFGAQYFRSKSPILWMTKNGAPLELGESHCRFRSWQVDLGLSYHIDFYTPYLSVLYEKSRFSLKAQEDVMISRQGNHLSSTENKNRFGLALGCAFGTGKIFMLNLETRLISEEAVTVTADFRF